VVHPVRQQYSFDEYVRLEELSPIKHEFLDGHVWAMAGGSPEHAGIAANIAMTLGVQLRDRPCRVFSSDLRVRVKETGLGTYPDLSVVYGRLETDPDDPKQQTVINPKVVVEVLSPSTEAYDRGEKLSHYKRIPSLEDIVLIAHDRKRIEVWHRDARGWTLEVVEDEGTATLRAIECTLLVAEVFKNPLEAIAE
jgi:Uma2 family endonuclease